MMTSKQNLVLSTNEMGRKNRIFICFTVMLLVIGWLYRLQILNGFTILAGDRYDGVISTTILEHWYNVFRGQSNWAEVGYFHPYTRVIAQTDAYFILGVLYTPFRLLGFDQFISAELVNMIMKAIGFIAAYVMCRRVFAFSFYGALLAAALFTLSNGMTVHSSRSQLSTVALAPVMVILFWHAYHAMISDQVRRLRKYGILSALLFGAWCLTCFYAAWFFSFFMLVLLIVAAVRGGRSGLIIAWGHISRHYLSLVLILTVTLLAMVPFLYAYLPKAQESGVRNYSEALMYAVPLENVLQVGNENLYLGKLYNDVLLDIQPDYKPQHEYYNTGFAIVLFGLFLLGAFHIYRHRRENRMFLLVCIMFASLISWMLTLKWHGYSLWYLPFHFIPGGRALRVVAAYHIFVALPIIVIAVRYLTSLKLPRLVVMIIAAVLIVEEFNTPGLGLDRKAELARIDVPVNPPAACKVFYTSAWDNQNTLAGPADIYAHNVSAMLIAQQLSMPTVNGVASFQPPDWDFAKPQKPDYDARVASYASKHQLTGLCKFDLDDKTWSVVPQTAIRRAPRDINFFKKSEWTGGISEISGMSGEEAWGAWSNDDVVQMEFTEPLPSRFELHISAQAFAHNIGKPFLISLGKKAANDIIESAASGQLILNADPEARVITIDNPGKENTISIRVPQPVSPAELGATDTRRLGIGIHALTIEPVNAKITTTK